LPSFYPLQKTILRYGFRFCLEFFFALTAILLRQVNVVGQVGLFTAGLQEVASKIVDRLDTEKVFSFRLFKNDCKLTPSGYVKDLNRLKPRPLRSIVLVDDSPVSYSMQPECSLPITKWIGAPDDNELQILAEQLELLLKYSSCPDSFNSGLHFLRLHRQYAAIHRAPDQQQWIHVRFVIHSLSKNM
jgi:hypothetical protein